MEVLTGTGLATAAGLNAYIPMLIVGLLARYTDLINLPQAWDWLSNPWLMAALGLLLIFEFAADKIPGVDHVNDVVQTAVRPAAGGLTFAGVAGAETVAVEPNQWLSDHSWLALLSGASIALVVHIAKAAVRVAVTAVTMGFGNPLVSTVEDAASVTLSLAAILIPALIVVLVALGAAALWRAWHWAKRRRTMMVARGIVPGDVPGS